MRSYIFTQKEKRMLEAYLTKSDENNVGLSNILNQIKKHKRLFEDVYLYLQVRKVLPVESP